MRIYSIVGPFDDWNSPMYERWAVLAHSVQIINEIESKEQAEAILKLMLEMDERKILRAVLNGAGLDIKQSPFSALQIEEAYSRFISK